jgi:hypothetical protein
MSKGILEEISEKLDNVLELLNKTGSAKPSKTKPADEDEDEDDKDEAPAPATRKRTRTPNKAKTLTAADIKGKLKAVLDGKGRKVALAILAKFDAEKVGDIEEDQFEKFAAACDKAVGGDSDEDDDLDL